MNWMELLDFAAVLGFTVKVFGVPVAISAWVLLLGAIIGTDAFVYIKKQQENCWSDCSWLGLIGGALIATIVTLFSIALHELAHGLVAHWVGVKIVAAGFTGWGAYVMPAAALSETPPLAEILIGAAGPLANWIIAAFAFVIVVMFGESLAENTIQYVSFINIRLAKLNLLPIFVLDGGKITEGLFRLLFGQTFARYAAIVVSVLVIIWLCWPKEGKKRKRLEDRLELV